MKFYLKPINSSSLRRWNWIKIVKLLNFNDIFHQVKREKASVPVESSEPLSKSLFFSSVAKSRRLSELRETTSLLLPTHRWSRSVWGSFSVIAKSHDSWTKPFAKPQPGSCVWSFEWCRRVSFPIPENKRLLLTDPLDFPPHQLTQTRAHTHKHSHEMHTYAMHKHNDTTRKPRLWSSELRENRRWSSGTVQNSPPVCLSVVVCVCVIVVLDYISWLWSPLNRELLENRVYVWLWTMYGCFVSIVDCCCCWCCWSVVIFPELGGSYS